MIEKREITRYLPVPLTHDEQRDLIQRQYQAEADTVAAQRERAVRLDTDELVEERTMEPEERQAGLPLGDGQDQAA
jgi:hypothetical protein